MNTLIKVDNVSVNYNSNTVFNNVTFDIKKGDFLGVIGPNGSGKTTLLKTILGIVKPSFGKVIVQKDTRIGYVPQFSNFEKSFPILVKEVVQMGILDKKLVPFFHAKKDQIKESEDIMKKVGIHELRNRNINKLSGGQLQKALIARALMSNPDILVLDEPTASLDSKSTNDIYELLKELNTEKTIILVSHDLNAVSSYVKNIACLNGSLHIHDDHLITVEVMNEVYGCPIDLIAHGNIPHRVLKTHEEDSDDRSII